MNIQELQTISGLQLNIIVVILENGGYDSIRQSRATCIWPRLQSVWGVQTTKMSWGHFVQKNQRPIKCG